MNLAGELASAPVEQAERRLESALGILLAVLVAASLPAGSARAGTAAWWRFESGSPPALDNSGNGNTGTITGASYSSQTAWLSPPNAANTGSLFLDAKTDQVEIPAGPLTNLDLFPNGITVEALIQASELPIPADDVGQRIGYVVWADDGAYELVLVSDALGRTVLKAGVNAVGGVSVPCTTSVSASYLNAVGFSHIALTYEAEQLDLYIDGMLVGQSNAPGGCGSEVGPVGFRDIVRIGNDETAIGFPSNDRSFPGIIDEVRISDGALDPEDFLRAGPNRLYISNWSGNRIQRRNLASGAFEIETPTPFDPRSMILGPDGLLYVAHQDANEVHRYDPLSGASIGTFAQSPELMYALALEFGADGNLYVNTQVPQGVLRYDGTTGAFIDTFVTGTEVAGGISSLHFGPEGDLYVGVDADVLRFDGQTGAFIDTFTSGGPQRFLDDFVFGPDGDLYATIYDSGLISRVAHFDGVTGAYVSDLVAPGSPLVTGSGLAFGPEGDLWVADFQGRQVLRFDGQSGAFVEVFSSQTGQIDDILFVPEPHPLALLASGLAGLACLWRAGRERRGRRLDIEPRLAHDRESGRKRGTARSSLMSSQTSSTGRPMATASGSTSTRFEIIRTPPAPSSATTAMT